MCLFLGCVGMLHALRKISNIEALMYFFGEKYKVRLLLLIALPIG